MNNINSLCQKAIKEVEKLFVLANWQDGYLLDKNYFVREQSKPLFFKDASPPIDAKFKVVLPQLEPTFYALYNIIDAENYTANNITVGVKIMIAITIYADDNYLFFSNDVSSESEIKITAFLEDFLNGLEKNKWGYSLDSSAPVAATEGGGDYEFRTVYIIEKIFKQKEFKHGNIGRVR